MSFKEHKFSTKSFRKINSRLDTGENTSTLLTVPTKGKNPNYAKRNILLTQASSSKQQEVCSESVAKSKNHPITAYTVHNSKSAFKKQKGLDAVQKQIIPTRVTATSKKHTLSTKKITQTKTQSKTNDRQMSHSQSLGIEMPKLRTIIENITSFMKIDHENIYPLLGIFIDYVQLSLPSRVQRISFSHDELETLSEEVKDKIDHFEKQKIMDHLLSPGVEFDNLKKQEYEDDFMKHKLNFVLPILRKCDGNVNCTDKNGQTILYIFIEKYVVVFKILSEEELLKPEYENSSEKKLRIATLYVIDELLKKGASVNMADVKGNTPLHIMAKHKGNEEIMEILLKHFTQVDSCNKKGDTVLHLMASKNKSNEKHVENMCTLLSKGADMHKRNNNGKAPIDIAIETCNVKVLNVFDEKGADFNLKTKDGKTLVHLVCNSASRNDNKKMDTIDLLVNKNCNFNAMDNEGYSPLHYAVKYCSSRVIQKLINLGSNMVSQTKEMNLTPFHLAAQFGRPNAIKTLIEAGVDVNNVAVGGIIPLHLAVLNSDIQTVECLIANEADVHCRDAIFGFTPIHLTAFACKEKLDLLVSKGADVNVRTKKGITPLHLASMLGNVEVVEGLCNHGSDINCKDYLFGMTPLHWSSMKGKRLNLSRISCYIEGSEDELMISEFWKPLFLKTCQNCDNYDDTNFCDSRNICTMFKPKTNVCTIILQPNNEVLKLLLKFGAHVDVQDYEARTPLHNILKSDNADGMKYLIEYGLDFNDFDSSHRILNTWNSVKVRSYVLWNAMKLKVAGLPVAEVYVSKVFKPQFQDYFSQWQDEVKQLKTYMLESKVSLYDSLRMKPNNRSAYFNQVISLQHDLKIYFPVYYSLIFAKFRQTVVRANLEKLARLALSWITDIRLLDSCYERVFLYLTNVDLRTFIDSVKSILH